jgi:hypothetical protein
MKVMTIGCIVKAKLHVPAFPIAAIENQVTFYRTIYPLKAAIKN